VETLKTNFEYASFKKTRFVSLHLFPHPNTKNTFVSTTKHLLKSSSPSIYMQ